MLTNLEMITDCYHTVSGNRIEGDIPESDPKSPESPPVVIGDTDDSGGGDNDYNGSDPSKDLDGSQADDDQSVEYDSGIEDNPYTKQRGEQKGGKDSDPSENSDSGLEEKPHTNRKGKGKQKGGKGRVDKRKKKKVNRSISLSWRLTYVL